MRRQLYLPLIALAGIALAGCPKANQDFEAGRKAESIQDYDTALVHYERALRANPTNSEYKLRATRMRSMDGQFHLQQGQKLMDKGQIEMAVAEFEKAVGVDPSNMAAQQELQKAMNMLAEKRAASQPEQTPPPKNQLLSGPPQLQPQIQEIGGLKMTNNSNVVFETVAKLAGLSVIFDPQFQSKRIYIELPRVSVDQALDAVARASGAFWTPLTSGVIFVAQDNPQNRRMYQDEVVKVFYLHNTLQPQDLTEITGGLRQMLNITHIVQMNSENAIVVRATPDEVAAAAKIIDSIDRARPEVLIHVQVLTANRDRLRTLGILPGQSVAVTFTPRPALQPSSSSSSSSGSGTGTGTGSTGSSTTQVTLNNLHSLSSGDWSATLPGATAQAILTDNQTRIIQDPQVRITDGERAKLTIGESIPIATGSFQAGVGLAATGVNPLVNTQFQYKDIGVSIDVQPRVHADNEVSMKILVEISSLAGSTNIGGINQPIFADNKIDEGEIRLKEGQASILGGLITQNQTINVNGIPGVGQIPLMKYLFSQNTNETQDQEVLIILTPEIVRFSPFTAEDLRSLDTGSDLNVHVYREAEQALAEPEGKPQGVPPAPPTASTPNPNAQQNGAAAQLQFDPGSVALKQGDSATVGLKVANINDLFSIPLLIHYDPAVIQISEVRNGGFLSGGNQDIAVVQHIDPQRGEAVISATRQPNTPGVSGTGTLLGLVVKAVGPGTSTIQILQVNARNSQQQTIPLVSGEATVQVQ